MRSLSLQEEDTNLLLGGFERYKIGWALKGMTENPFKLYGQSKLLKNVNQLFVADILF